MTTLIELVTLQGYKCWIGGTLDIYIPKKELRGVMAVCNCFVSSNQHRIQDY
jgi:hypothetical protein